ncbi:MarR family winged helix-turn-helix transcriptional regulator [Fictibacillus sp. 18YEL24]|uniref:MarR family winged helix-turn-helix transcriptional regulator n=1 Tax=Fictibacillus sp. 18YEL24 TaxID=2745875 RepID=UPI0018CE5752|nr:MarR family transcriptional regulator [Fictibacillus sp. 18YEL24]MBH0171479.1 MarR family transcriptional regulator [Fictibacillus sp. 18YEL24]
MKKETMELFTLFKTVEYLKTRMTDGEPHSFRQINLLLILLKRKDMNISEIAYEMDVSPPSISALTEKLIKKELIQRTHNQVDRRIVTVNLTEKGMFLARDLKNKQKKIINQIETSLTKEELFTFVDLLDRINKS